MQDKEMISVTIKKADATEMTVYVLGGGAVGAEVEAFDEAGNPLKDDAGNPVMVTIPASAADVATADVVASDAGCADAGCETPCDSASQAQDSSLVSPSDSAVDC